MIWFTCSASLSNSFFFLFLHFPFLFPAHNTFLGQNSVTKKGLQRSKTQEQESKNWGSFSCFVFHYLYLSSWWFIYSRWVENMTCWTHFLWFPEKKILCCFYREFTSLKFPPKWRQYFRFDQLIFVKCLLQKTEKRIF